MAWIESHQSLSRHRKTLRAAALLKTDRHKVIGHLHELWWWALDNADIYGLLPECTYEEIAEAAGWPTRDATRFVEAFITAGFIDRDEMQRVELSLHDWYEFAGKLIQARAENKERMREKRATNVQRTTIARNAVASDARAPATVPNRTQPNRTVENHIPPVANATSPKGARRRVTIVDDEFRQVLEDEFYPVFGSYRAVRDVMDEAMSHKALGKRTDQRAYLRNWVRREAESVGRRNGKRAQVAMVAGDCACAEIRELDAKGFRNGPRTCPEHGFIDRLTVEVPS